MNKHNKMEVTIHELKHTVEELKNNFIELRRNMCNMEKTISRILNILEGDFKIGDVGLANKVMKIQNKIDIIERIVDREVLVRKWVIAIVGVLVAFSLSIITEYIKNRVL